MPAMGLPSFAMLLKWMEYRPVEVERVRLSYGFTPYGSNEIFRTINIPRESLVMNNAKRQAKSLNFRVMTRER